MKINFKECFSKSKGTEYSVIRLNSQEPQELQLVAYITRSKNVMFSTNFKELWVDDQKVENKENKTKAEVKKYPYRGLMTKGQLFTVIFNYLTPDQAEKAYDIIFKEYK